MSPRRQPQARLTEAQRHDQIRLLVQTKGEQTLAQCAKPMGCSETLVLFYAKRMQDVVLERRHVLTRAGARMRTYLTIPQPSLLADVAPMKGVAMDGAA